VLVSLACPLPMHHAGYLTLNDVFSYGALMSFNQWPSPLLLHCIPLHCRLPDPERGVHVRRPHERGEPVALGPGGRRLVGLPGLLLSLKQPSEQHDRAAANVGVKQAQNDPSAAHSAAPGGLFWPPLLPFVLLLAAAGSHPC